MKYPRGGFFTGLQVRRGLGPARRRRGCVRFSQQNRYLRDWCCWKPWLAGVRRWRLIRWTGPYRCHKSGVTGVLDADLRTAALSALRLSREVCRNMHWPSPGKPRPRNSCTIWPQGRSQPMWPNSPCMRPKRSRPKVCWTRSKGAVSRLPGCQTLGAGSPHHALPDFGHAP